VSRFRLDSNLSFEAGRIGSSQAYVRPISARARLFVDLRFSLAEVLSVFGENGACYTDRLSSTIAPSAAEQI
jgi:hypothetical protein